MTKVHKILDINIINSKPKLELFLNKLRTRQIDVPPTIRQTVEKILEDVRINGDKAVFEFTKEFDRHELPIKYKPKGKKPIDDPVIEKMLKTSINRIRLFHERQIEKSWILKERGAVLGQIITPIQRVGVYIPGGKAAYPSTVLMNVIPAQVAGVKEIALCVPTPKGFFNPYVLMAIEMLGIKEVYRVGGAQAIAAMAYGTKTIKRVDKIVGPGNIYVATAKRLVFGQVDIDMIAGPSEILIIADDSADASLIAADMISQAEHDELASSVLITDSNKISAKVLVELNKQLNKISKKDIVRASLKNYGAIITTKNLDEAIKIANQIAPEHLEVMIDKPRSVLSRITNAGAIFLGKWSPEPIGDYSAGPNHTLPTGGTARFASPLGTYDFFKRTSLIDFTEEGFMRLAPTVERFAILEGLDAHAESIRIRQAQSLLAPEEA